jgi:WD40 repeat protein
MHGCAITLAASADCVLALLAACCIRLLATGGNDTLICIWDLQQAVPQTVIYRPDEAVRALSFSADHAMLAYCQEHLQGQPSSVEVMDPKTGTLDVHKVQLQPAAFQQTLTCGLVISIEGDACKNPA